MTLSKKLAVACQWLQQARTVLFITGAGISAESGLPTYRGVGGLYNGVRTEEGYTIEDILSGATFLARPDLTWKYLTQIEAACRGARPNAAHKAIAALEKTKNAWVVTQNVDSFHRDAGSRNLAEIHGNLHDLRCTGCDFTERVENFGHLSTLPRCLQCKAVLRPDIVLFGELLPEDAVRTYQGILAVPPDLMVSVGTSALFPYIAGPVMHPPPGCRTIDINPHPNDLTPYVDLHLEGTACEVLAALVPAGVS